jgi:ABC-type dipeptide/oligopeptide/nickel transport system permease component
MRRYIARQLVQLVVVILGISVLAFMILHVLGDPVLLLLPQNAGKEEFARYHRLLGLDRPLYVQYWKFLSATSASRGTPTRRPSSWSSSGCRPRSTSRCRASSSRS